jgi:2-keto-3-deoxy-L-fuconate dehydrogenase
MADLGANVIADEHDYTADDVSINDIVADAGRIDVFVLQFAGPQRLSPATELQMDPTSLDDEDFQDFLDEMTWPVVRFTRAVLPQMIERQEGKIVGILSGSVLRPMDIHLYSAARAAAMTFLQSVGRDEEVAGNNVQVNGIAPTHHESDFYFTDESLADGKREELESEIPVGRLGTEKEMVYLVEALAGHPSDWLAGNIVPFGGGRI